MKILFICTGNTCRSPMAEALARKIFAEKGIACEVASAGVSVLMSRPPSDYAVQAMSEYGIDITDHKTRQIMQAALEEADLVLTMTKRHKDFLKLQTGDNSELLKKIYVLNEYVGIDHPDVADPFGGDADVYRACASELATAITKLADKLLEKDGGRDKMETIALGCDHGGLPLMLEVIKYLDENKIPYQNFGTLSEASVDYPNYAQKVAKAILKGECAKGILICTTGIGISIAANRYKGIRAALCHDVYSAKATRLHNNANVLAMGARVIGVGAALEVLKTFLETPFSDEERHQRRIGEIESI